MNSKEEIYKIIQHVLTAKDVLKTGFSKWRRTCENTLPRYTGTTHSRQSSEEKIILDRLCTTPSYFENNIVNPLFGWLEKYHNIADRKVALTGPDASYKFVRDGINHVYRFVVVLNYFAEFSNNFIRESSSSRPNNQQFLENQTLKQEYRNVFNDHIDELIGCKNALGTRLLGLSKNLKSQYLEQVEDKIKYLNSTCTNIRYQRLNN